MKGYTSLEQSKKLAEILPIESADMFYRSNGIDVKLMWEHNAQKVTSPCWSLAALLDVLPDDLGLLKCFDDGLYYCVLRQNHIIDDTSDYNNPVDACYEMIIKLHEQKLL